MKPYIKAYQDRMHDSLVQGNLLAYVNGAYFVQAIACTIGNIGKSKNELTKYPDKPLPFFEAKEEPKELTEEEKIEQTKQLFAKLGVMKTNFELANS